METPGTFLSNPQFFGVLDSGVRFDSSLKKVRESGFRFLSPNFYCRSESAGGRDRVGWEGAPVDVEESDTDPVKPL